MNMLSPSLSMTVSTEMPTKFYHFCVKETVDSESGVDMTFFRYVNLKWVRKQLKEEFGVPKSRRIFYIDDDGDSVPIDSECEFNEAMKLAKKIYEKNNAIPLIVGTYNFDSPKIHKKSLNDTFKSNTLECSNTLPPQWFTEYMESMKKDMVSIITNEVVKNVTETLDKRLNSFMFSHKELNQSKSQHSSLTTRHPQCFSDLNKENQKIKFQDKEQLSHVSIEHANESSNTNTMKNIQMKKDVISTITNEVMKEKTELFELPADSLTSVPSNDSFRNHYSSNEQLTQYFDCLRKENQKTIKLQDKEQSNDDASKSQDKEQLSHVSIEHANESPNANATKNIQMKKNVISVISNEMAKELFELPATNSLTSAILHPSYVNVDESDSLRYLNILENSMQQLKQKRFIEDAICAKKKEEEKEKKKPQHIAQKIAAYLSSDIEREKEQSVQNNMWENHISQKNLPLQNPKPSDEKVHSEAFKKSLKLIKNKFPMNCSVNGQMLDEDLLNKDNAFDNKSQWEIEKNVEIKLANNFCPCDQEEKKEIKSEEDDDAFEIIQMPTLNDELIEQRHHDSNRDSPSFELLSEPPSPPCSIHLNEDHFSINEEKFEQQFMKTKSPNSIYVVDIHGKIFSDENQTVNHDERISIDLKNQSDVSFFVTNKDLLTEDEDEEDENETHSSKSPEIWWNRDDAIGLHDDVRNSHASYLTVQTHCDSKTQSQCSCQSQTDSGDFTQSFHSHTTSVTDTTMHANIYASKYVEQTTNKDVPETTTMTASKNNHNDIRMDGDWTKETRTNEKYHHEKCPNNYPEYLRTSISCPCSRDSSFNASYQSYRTNKSSDRSCTNIGSSKASVDEQALLGTADSVHILPETLVSAAAQVGSFAYDTAREMFDKLRTHTKEDPLKHHDEVKYNKKPFSVGNLPFY